MSSIKTCPACNYTRQSKDSAVPEWECPKCQKSYNKSVQAELTPIISYKNECLFTKKNILYWSLLWNTILLIAVFWIFPGPVELVNTAAFVRSAVKTTGTVNSNQKYTSDYKKEDGSYKVRETPVFVFRAQDGRQQKFIDPEIVADTEQYPIGMQIPVCYDPHNPENAKIDGFMTIWLPLFWHLIPDVMVLLSVCCQIYMFLRQRSNQHAALSCDPGQ